MPAEEVDVVVVGAGQAGLAASHELTRCGVEHVVLERGADPGGAWAGRWDSFCLVTPNELILLPGAEYRGADPQGFLVKAEIVAHLRRYAASLSAPIRTATPVERLRVADRGVGFVIETPDHRLSAREVVVATGAFQRPHLPLAAAGLAAQVPTLTVPEYRNPGHLPDGAVLVVGSGQSGCQIAEELHLAGRRVILAASRAPWFPRRLEGRDIVSWLLELGFFEAGPAALPPGARNLSNPLVTGKDGGRDLNLRTLADLGVQLTGRLAGVSDGHAHFAPDLAASVAFGDARYADVRAFLRAGWAARGLPEPAMPDPPPFPAVPARESLALSEVGAVVVATGFRPAYGEWVDIPAAFDPDGYPVTDDGASRAVPGLNFVGVHFMRKRRSGLLFGVGEDAAVVAEGVAARL